MSFTGHPPRDPEPSPMSLETVRAPFGHAPPFGGEDSVTVAPGCDTVLMVEPVTWGFGAPQSSPTSPGGGGDMG